MHGGGGLLLLMKFHNGTESQQVRCWLAVAVARAAAA
eukprot:COSAG01_NODE_30125_length_622_cov_1.003824_1_plen_36_part_01